MCYYCVCIAKPSFTKPPFVNSRRTARRASPTPERRPGSQRPAEPRRRTYVLNSYLNVYVHYMYIHIYIYIHIHTYTYYIYIYIYVCYVHIHIQIHIHIHLHLHLHLHLHIHIYVYTYIHTCVYTYIYVYVYTDIWRRRSSARSARRRQAASSARRWTLAGGRALARDRLRGARPRTKIPSAARRRMRWLARGARWLWRAVQGRRVRRRRERGRRTPSPARRPGSLGGRRRGSRTRRTGPRCRQRREPRTTSRPTSPPMMGMRAATGRRRLGREGRLSLHPEGGPGACPRSAGGPQGRAATPAPRARAG